MSASLFADMYIDYGNSPTNYIEYNDGEKKFGELQKGDEIYLYHYSNDKILNITIDGKLTVGRKNIHIKTKPFRTQLVLNDDIVFGPVDASCFGEKGEYTPSNVEKSSICISFGGGWAVGTNRETVLKYAKSDISNFIQKAQSDIKNLQKEIESLNKKLKNIV